MSTTTGDHAHSFDAERHAHWEEQQRAAAATDAVRDIAVDDISRTIRLMWVASSLALALFIGVRYWLVGAA